MYTGIERDTANDSYEIWPFHDLKDLIPAFELSRFLLPRQQDLIIFSNQPHEIVYHWSAKRQTLLVGADLARSVMAEVMAEG